MGLALVWIGIGYCKVQAEIANAAHTELIDTVKWKLDRKYNQTQVYQHI